MLEKGLKLIFLTIGKNKTAAKLMRRYGAQLGASRFVAGTTLQDAIAAVKRLEAEGKEATIDHLGEFVQNELDAARSADICLKSLEAMQAHSLKANLSLKLTSLGLDLDPAICERHMRSILSLAATQNRFVRIDMEDYSHCQSTIDLYKKLRPDYPNLGLVIQAYLHRSKTDLYELGSNANLRLVKGAYKESPEVAFPKKETVDETFLQLIHIQLDQGYAAVATHDPQIVHQTLRRVTEKQIQLDRFEFQMLYGIGTALQNKLAQEGYKVRIYVPFGEDWFGYFMRRLAERPANVWFLLKHWRR
ncbi:proline dehydrogenase family protein [Paenibacillus sp. GCM10027627]|uniref:proline dehydrogenase family protein n=1 Tax=unclassified Paenibacillus TaxID=185978 RepID=UPI0036326B1D